MVKPNEHRYGFVQFKNAADVEKVLMKSRHRIAHGNGSCVIDVKAANLKNQPDYESIMSNPLMVPPKQDAPSNILNSLNDQCFYEIFRRLDLPDLVNIAEVCQHFNGQAKKTFSSSAYKQMNLTDTVYRDQPNKMKKVLRHFGADIQSLHIESVPRADTYLLNAIHEYCTENLKELRLELFHIEEDAPALRPLFSKLEKLELSNCKARIKLDQSMADCTGLQVLRFDSCDLEYDDECIGRTFMNLQEAYFSHTNLSAEIFQHFIVSNPSIVKLSMNQAFDEARALHLIGQNMPNLTELEFIESNYKSNFQEDVLSIGQLHSLNVLQLHFNWYQAAPLLNALVTNNVPIKHLKMESVWIDDNAAENISKLNQIKILEIIGARDLTKGHLIEIAKDLHELQELRLISATDLTTVDLKKIVSNAGKLKLMKLRSCGDFTIEIDDYHEMLYSVQNRRENVNLLIEVESDGNTVNVPEEILNEHRQKFFIDEQEMERDHDVISNDSNNINDADSWYDASA